MSGPVTKVNRPSLFRRILRWLKRIVATVVAAYIGLVVYLAANEPYLVYPGSKYPAGNWKPDRFAFEEVEFEAADGISIVGWFLPLEGARETVLVCHGNAENVAQSSAHTGIQFQQVCNANVLVFDYRGFGKSGGGPNERGVLEDAEAALHWLNERTGTRPEDVIIVGHSIGGGPAVHLAAKYGAKALFLQRTFASLVEPAQRKYWFVPVSLIMQNRYPSAEKIKNCFVPLHQSHGDRDGLVPIESGRKLFDASPARLKEFVVNRGKGHWDPLPPEYWESVADFLDKVNRQRESMDQSDADQTGAERIDR